MNENNTISEKEAYCFLRSIKGFTDSKITLLHKHFLTYREAVTASPNEYEDILTGTEIEAICKARDSRDIKEAYREISNMGISLHLPMDATFPDKLKNIPSPPKAFFSMGKLPDYRLPSVAIIGARSCSAYGADMTKEFAKELSSQGIQVISGMARGIDGIAQEVAIDNGGYSCGILGCGVDVCYPASNKELYNKLIAKGGLISEYYPGTKPLPQFFPARNRIISGICDALLVIEAKAKSGTLITVSMALEQGREIFALPGRLTDSLSYGCNLLIRDGATPLLNPIDFTRSFLEHLGYSYSKREGDEINSHRKLPAMDLTTEEKAIISVLDYNPRNINEIYALVCRNSSMSIPKVMMTLTDLLVRDIICCVDGSNYYLSSM